MPQRESNEFRPVVIRDSTKAIYDGDWSYQITAQRSRPVGSWITSKDHADLKGISVSGLTKGTYWVWFRIDDDPPYVPVPDPVELPIS